MTRQYWMKLWIEMLDDETVGMLPDHLWRRWVELLLIAKLRGNDGSLPDVSRIAWHLRVDRDAIVTEMLELASRDLLEEVGGNWRIPKFAERQSPRDTVERQRIHRKWRDVLGPDVTERDNFVTQKTDIQKTDLKPIADGKPPSARDVQNAIREELEEAFHQATRIPRPKATTEKQRREAGEMWWVPLRQIAEAYEWDVAQARAAINRAVKEMRASKPTPLTIGSPKSILKVVMSGLGTSVSTDDAWLASQGLPGRTT